MNKIERQLREQQEMDGALNGLTDAIRNIENGIEEMLDEAGNAMLDNNTDSLNYILESILDLKGLMGVLKDVKYTFGATRIKTKSLSSVGAVPNALKACTKIINRMPSLSSMTKSISKLSRAVAEGNFKMKAFSAGMRTANRTTSSSYDKKAMDELKMTVQSRISGRLPNSPSISISEFTQKINEEKKVL